MSDDGINETTQPAAGFEDLASEAATLEGAAAAASSAHAEAQQQASLQQNTRELMRALVMARAMAAPVFDWWDQFDRVWGDTTLEGMANNGAAVMELHGWTMGEFFGRWGPYIGLGMAVLPPVVVTVRAVKVREAALRRQASQQAEQAHQAGQVDPVMNAGHGGQQ